MKFIEPMECLPVAEIPEGDQWTYELKLDGYRLELVDHRLKAAGKSVREIAAEAGTLRSTVQRLIAAA